MKVIGLIPARAGSKGIINKNLQEVDGRSLIQITVESANRVSMFSNVYVSSDSEDILQIGSDCGATKIKRSDFASSDAARAEDVVSHFINFLGDDAKKDLVIVYLQPTSPFTTPSSIEGCINLYLKHKKPVITVKKVTEHPDKMLTLDEAGVLSLYSADSQPTKNRQDLESLLLPTGGIYVFSIEDFFVAEVFPVMGAIPYLVTGKEALDIDTQLDLDLARSLGSKDEF
jgi:CMP-N-acetylneuraminic acid synthetase